MLHARLSSLSLLEFDVELLELGLSTAELRHSLAVVHLLDLVVLELLVIKLLLGWVLRDSTKDGTLFRNHATRTRVEFHRRLVESIVACLVASPRLWAISPLFILWRHFPHLVVEVVVPSSGALTSVNLCVHGGDLLLGWVVVEDLLRLLLSLDHCLDLA